MVFQFVYGKPPVPEYSVTVYGYPNSTVTIDGGSPVSLDSTGKATVTLLKGSHTFADGHIGTNTKNISISSNCTVVVGLLVGTISEFAEPTPNGVHTDTGVEDVGGSESISKAIPDGNVAPISFAFVSGQVRIRQTVSGTNYGPGAYAKGSISVDGVSIASGTSNSLGYGPFNTVRYSAWESMVGTKAITEKTSGSVSATINISVTTEGSSMMSYSYADGSASEVYVY